MDVWMGECSSGAVRGELGSGRARTVIHGFIFILNFKIFVWEGLADRRGLIPTGASSSLSMLSLEHPFPQGILTQGILIPEHPSPWVS